MAHLEAARHAAALLAAALREGHGTRLEVVGGCMRPLLLRGDRVRIERDAAPAPGQVALAWTTEGRWICHRVVDGGPGWVELAGDAALAVARLPAARVPGRVVEIERRGRFLRLAASPAPVERLLTLIHRLSIRMRGTRALLPLEAARRRLRSRRSLALWRRAAPLDGAPRHAGRASQDPESASRPASRDGTARRSRPARSR